MNITNAIQWGKAQLTASDTPQLDAEILLAHSLETTQTQLYTWPEKTLSETEMRSFQTLIQRRTQGEPIAYLTGHREFWSLDFLVTPDVLIPRPETELLVELTLQNLPKNQPLNIADLGTGCGAIAIALAHERPNWNITATDASPKAIAIAQKNADRLNIKNIQFIETHWCDGLTKNAFDAIVSNPPYIPENNPHLNQGDLRFEPKTALTAGPDGLQDIRLIAKQAINYIKPTGLLLIEHGYDQANAIRKLLISTNYQNVKSFQDLSAQDRVTIGTKTNTFRLS